jgi:hypothetical protein
MKRLIALLSVFVAFSLAPRGAGAQTNNAGTVIRVRLLDRLDTGETQVGRQFSATVEETVRLDKRTVLTRGTTVKGTVTEVVSSGRLKRPASITLQLAGLGRAAVRTETLKIDGKSHDVRNTALIGGGAAAGAILGGIAGGGKGAIIGTAIGAGAGTGTAYVTGKQEIVLPSETELTFAIAGDGSAPERSAAPQPRYAETSNTSEPQAAYDDSNTSPSRDNHFSLGIYIGPPPPPPVAYVEPAPGPEFVWVEGYWYPTGRHYEWHAGYWTQPPYAGAYWVRPHHDGERFFEGYWEGNRGRVEHDHHWDYDRDRDFHDRDHDRDHHQHGHQDD